MAPATLLPCHTRQPATGQRTLSRCFCDSVCPFRTVANLFSRKFLFSLPSQSQLSSRGEKVSSFVVGSTCNLFDYLRLVFNLFRMFLVVSLMFCLSHYICLKCNKFCLIHDFENSFFISPPRLITSKPVLDLSSTAARNEGGST